MIISASRRTDIPAWYTDWLINRLRAGWCLVRNPYNPRQVSRVSLEAREVDCIVFWTKNPAPLLERLDELDRLGHRYYFLFTLNPYPEELEPGLPCLEDRLAAFRALAGRLGPERVIWRYDPVIISDRTGFDWHREAFGHLLERLKGSTRRVITSPLSLYRKTRRRLADLETRGWRFHWEAGDDPRLEELFAHLARRAREAGMEPFACATERSWSDQGLRPSSCVDPELVNRLWGLQLPPARDPGQRQACRCAPSRDIGAPDSCLGDCLYCYATRSPEAARRSFAAHSPESPLLIGLPDEPGPPGPLFAAPGPGREKAGAGQPGGMAGGMGASRRAGDSKRGR